MNGRICRNLQQVLRIVLTVPSSKHMLQSVPGIHTSAYENRVFLMKYSSEVQSGYSFRGIH